MARQIPAPREDEDPDGKWLLPSDQAAAAALPSLLAELKARGCCHAAVSPLGELPDDDCFIRAEAPVAVGSPPACRLPS